MAKRIGGWIVIALAGALSVYVYMGERAAERAGASSAASAPAASSGSGLWLNGEVYRIRARALFDRGLGRLGEATARDADFRSAYDAFRRSLALNPFSAVAHFDFGQALQYFNALDFPAPERYFDEYRKAADLSGVDTVVYLEVGKVLLSRWAGLNQDERLFAEKIIRTLLSFSGPERLRRCDVLLNLWDVNVRDAQVLERILPEDAETLRRAAVFLGGKGIFLETRLDFLAQAENLDLKEAGSELRAGNNERNARRPAEALGRFRAAQRLLAGIRFYQNLAPRKKAMNPDEYGTLRKSVQLGILKCLLDASAEPKDLLDDFRAYLEAEDSVGAVGELESLLRARGIVETQSRAGFIDLVRLSLSLELNFKQSRYREIVQTGQDLSQNLLVVPEDQRAPYGRIFELIGDACQRLDDLYESTAYYEKALNLKPDDVVVLIKMRRNFERLNDDKALKKLEPRIKSLLSPRETPLIDAVWASGEPQVLTLLLDEMAYRLSFDFSDYAAGPPPLISAIFNGRVAVETLLTSDLFEMRVQAVAGPNELRITSVNRVCRPLRMTLIPDEEAAPGTGKIPAAGPAAMAFSDLRR